MKFDKNTTLNDIEKYIANVKKNYYTKKRL